MYLNLSTCLVVMIKAMKAILEFCFIHHGSDICFGRDKSCNKLELPLHGLNLDVFGYWLDLNKRPRSGLRVQMHIQGAESRDSSGYRLIYIHEHQAVAAEDFDGEQNSQQHQTGEEQNSQHQTGEKQNSQQHQTGEEQNSQQHQTDEEKNSQQHQTDAGFHAKQRQNCKACTSHSV
ncbi:hypothetical protein WISP_18523 [Willisornis vidua]|uniref:Uncharacterized protein n=1 Tax=Willisornis vidua TaxID=1566151 RepID=A0ABQ9DUF8_9PASS|nr:hypothetical protein WISP_18523 [Willisornis vidua]